MLSKTYFLKLFRNREVAIYMHPKITPRLGWLGTAIHHSLIEPAGLPRCPEVVMGSPGGSLCMREGVPLLYVWKCQGRAAPLLVSLPFNSLTVLCILGFLFSIQKKILLMAVLLSPGL